MSKFKKMISEVAGFSALEQGFRSVKTTNKNDEIFEKSDFVYICR